jgi:plasmid replication initiation protein
MESEILYKHHLAAHASANFTLIERKVLNIFLYNAFPKLAEQEEFKIDVSSILKMLGIKTRNYTQIYKAIQNISCTLIEWGVLKTQTFQGELTGVTFLEKYNIRNGLVTYRIPRELRSLFVEPQRYTKIRMTTIAALKSSYGIALYENCSSYIGLGCTGWISIDDFKKLMGVKGKYIEYRDLNKRVIKTALDDINRHSEYKVDIIEFKEARKTTKIKFNIKNKPAVQLDKVVSLNTKVKQGCDKNNSLFQSLEKFGIPKKRISSWLSSYDEEYIKERMDYVAGYKEARAKPALLTASIENNYQVNEQKEKPSPKIDRQELELSYAEYKKRTIISWTDQLHNKDWLKFCALLLKFVDHPIVKEELEERLENRSFKNYEATLNDMVDFTGRMIIAWRADMINLKPPTISSWKEFMANQCQNPA